MNESPELAAIARRWVDLLAAREFDAVANLFLRSEHSRYIGTDAHEWWLGSRYIDAYGAHQAEMPAFDLELLEVEAFESGHVGWAAVRTAITFEGLEPRELRWSLVFVMEDAIWRIAQSHGSIAVPNPEIMGVEMTKSLRDLLASMGADVTASLHDAVHRGVITLMFTDIESSTEIAAHVGDERWARVIEWHDATIRQLIEARNGVLVKTLGDGAMAAFESIHEAARAALEISEAVSNRQDDPRLAIRVGLHIGDVVRTEGDFLGTTVNKAARIAAAARGGEVMVSNSVVALLGDDAEFEVSDPKTVELKGIDGLHEVWKLRHAAS